MTGKWKTTIVIWSQFDPHHLELSQLAYDAESGSSICTEYDPKFIADPESDPSFEEAVEFFFEDDDE